LTSTIRHYNTGDVASFPQEFRTTTPPQPPAHAHQRAPVARKRQTVIMPSQRRVRLYGILALVTIVVLLYMSRAARQTHSSDFYTKTQQALQEREHAAAAKQRDAESVQARLQAAEEQAKKAADSKDKSGKVAIEGTAKKGVAGRVEIDSQDDKKVPGVAAQGGRTRDQTAMQKDETLEEHEVEVELDFILKQSPGMFNSC
jgi:DNA-binding protein H-NS